MPAKTFEEIIKTTAAKGPTGCGVLVLKDGKVLTGTRKERASRGQICGPGGHIEPGETPEEAAKREAMEEFNIECHDLRLLGVQDGGRHGTSAVFLCTDFTGKPRTDEEEMTNPKWLTIRQIRALDAFPPFLRSLELLPRDEVLKFNPYHSAKDGKFTSAGAAGSPGGDAAARISELKAQLKTTVRVPVFSNGEVTRYITNDNGKIKLTDDKSKAIPITDKNRDKVTATLEQQFKKKPLHQVGEEDVERDANMPYAQKKAILDEISAIERGFNRASEMNAADAKRKQETYEKQKAAVENSYFTQNQSKGEPFYHDVDGDIICNYSVVARTIAREAQRQGAEITHTSATGADKFASSVYIKRGDTEIRVSDHALPMTDERTNRGGTRWDGELVLNNYGLINLAGEIKTKQDLEKFVDGLFKGEDFGKTARKAITFEEVLKFNPYHGPDGRSSSTQGGETMKAIEERQKEFRIYKADEDQRLVFGWASVAITVDGTVLEDRQHDTIDPEDLEEAAYEYVLNFRDTGEEHLPGYRKKGRLVESCVFTPEKQRAMGLPEGALPVAWWIGFKIDDEDTWQRIKDGTYKMFSIEGRAQREPIEKADSTARTFDEVLKFNPYHDGAGRFASASGATSMTVFTNSPQGQKAIANIKARELAAMGAGGGSPGNTKPAEKPKDVDANKPQTKKFKKIDDEQAKAMAKEMGQSPEQISDEDMKALQGYINTANSFDINESLRDGEPISEMTPKNQKTIATMDKHMQPSTEDIKVQRMCGRALLKSLGLGNISMEDVTNGKLKSLEGKVYSQNGYTSTSFDIGENVFTGRPIKMNINVPKGAKMLISPTREWDDKVIEAEIILARNTPMRITKARVKKNGWGENVVELDIDVLLD